MYFTCKNEMKFIMKMHYYIIIIEDITFEMLKQNIITKLHACEIINWSNESIWYLNLCQKMLFKRFITKFITPMIFKTLYLNFWNEYFNISIFYYFIKFNKKIQCNYENKSE
jgi:hypothetical protein